MYLKSIEMQGFKSFANKIKLEFKDGITGIVGPNGSGKSNVADAVRWVLGEQSAKELRGASMQDVIFSGTETRKPMGYASVSLCLDNTDHILSDDYDEVTVTRRVYRSGESEYLINGNVCRLKDVSEMFFDTGIGKEGYSIIGQGQVEKILSGKPEERRELFDEAAGIVKFKKRKNASLKKLEQEKENLVRINDILSELEKQVGPLKEQSETARIFLDKREELKTLDINAFVLEGERQKKELKEIDDKIEIANNDSVEVEKALQANSNKYEDAIKALEEYEKLIEEKRHEISEAANLKNKLENDIKILKEQINSLNSSSEYHKKRETELKFEKVKTENDIEALSERKKSVDAKVDEYKSGSKDTTDKFEALKSEISVIDADINKQKDELYTLLNERSRIKSDIQRYDTMLEQSREKLAEIKARIEGAGEDQAAIEKNIEEALKELDSLNETIKQDEEKLEDFRKKRQGFDKELDQMNISHHALEVRYHERKAFLESLKNMAERYEGYGNSIRKVMEYKKENKGIFGVVADLIKVSAEYETAIETALGGNIQNIVTKDEATAKKMIEILKESKSGRATFLPLTSIVTREVKEKDALNAPGVIGQADELVEVTDKQFKAVSNTLLGNYIVVDNIDNALNLAKKYHYTLRIVTLTGEALNPGGSISGGAFKRSGNLLGRSREIDEIQAELKGILKEIDGVLIKVEEIKDEKNKCTDDLHALEDEIKEKELSRNTVTLNLKGFKDRKEELFGGLEGIKRESGQIDENIKDITQSRDKVKKELDTSVERENEIGALVDELNRNRAVKAEEADKVNSILIEADRNNAALLSEQRFTNENLEKLKESVVHFNEELESLAQSVESNENEILNKNDEIVSLKKRIEEESPDDDKKLTELNKVIADRDALNESQKDIFTERDSLAERKASNEKELIRLNAQREKIDSYFDSLRDYMWNEYELTLSGAGEFKTETDMELTDIKRRIATLKGDIKALGNVNVNSIEQYGEVMERFTFMDGQRKDIIEAEEDLKRAIAELDDEMRRQFTEEFAKIAEQFDVVFRELFGGGHGKIELTDSDDVLEAGIRITAEPPGKKLQNMMQLSGGEKSLSAIALLFGIQRLKPSPFCLLDEIEAALDEANVDRFANYLSQLSGKTQFIVITHRRGTMTKADRLYGITMQEKGVSTEVNVDLDSEDYE